MSDNVKAALLLALCVVAVVAGIAFNMLRDYAVLRFVLERGWL